MSVEIKFCGLTRASDAALGASLGARYLGVVFADSPRRVDAATARTIFHSLPTSARPGRVGVFGAIAVPDAADVAHQVGLDVIQLHGDPLGADIRELRTLFNGEIWAAVRVAGSGLPDLTELVRVADAILVDRKSANGDPLGGTGRSFDWEGVADQIAELRSRTRIVLAGGLNPDNVGRAIAVLTPSVVDVSSGVESAPGIKDPALMTDFVRAVGAATR